MQTSTNEFDFAGCQFRLLFNNKGFSCIRGRLEVWKHVDYRRHGRIRGSGTTTGQSLEHVTFFKIMKMKH